MATNDCARHTESCLSESLKKKDRKKKRKKKREKKTRRTRAVRYVKRYLLNEYVTGIGVHILTQGCFHEITVSTLLVSALFHHAKL